jgi:TPR repeat protein
MHRRRLAILTLMCALALGCADGPRNAAEGGDPDAQFALAAAYEEGLAGETQDYAAALEWYRRAAEQGHERAQYRLGLLLADGKGSAPNPTEAARWFREAANQGHSDAQLQLGILYDTGEGVAQDQAEAARLYRLAAEDGLTDAMYNLGLMYAAGQGVPRDEAEASRWFRLAAEDDDADAMFQLGVSYADGLGLEQNMVQAYLWLNRAAIRGSERAVSERDLLEARMTEEEIAEAQRLSKNW